MPTVSPATFGPAPDAKTVISKVCVAAPEVAVRVTGAVGAVAGAVYVTEEPVEGFTEPGFCPDGPDTAQLTVLLPVLFSVALTDKLPPTLIVCGAPGDKEIVPAELLTTICTLAVAAELAADVAVIVTLVVEETLAGAVYVVGFAVVLLRVPKFAGEVILQVTAVLLVFVTVAVSVDD